MMKKAIERIVGVALVTSLLAGPVHAQIATLDVNSLATLMQLRDQIVEIKRQVETQQDMLASMTGTRGWDYGSFNEYGGNLPEEWGDVYGDAMGGNSVYSNDAQAVLDALNNEVEGMSELEAVNHMNERLREKNATDRVMMQRVYDNQQLELREMEELAREIENAETQKEIQDLQARIQTAQGAIQANQVKLQNMAMLQEVQSRLIEDQREQAARNRLVGDGSENSFRAPRIN